MSRNFSQTSNKKLFLFISRGTDRAGTKISATDRYLAKLASEQIGRRLRWGHRPNPKTLATLFSIDEELAIETCNKFLKGKWERQQMLTLTPAS